MGDEFAYAAAFPETQELHDLVERAFNPEDHVAVSDAEYEHVRASRKKTAEAALDCFSMFQLFRDSIPHLAQDEGSFHRDNQGGPKVSRPYTSR